VVSVGFKVGDDDSVGPILGLALGTAVVGVDDGILVVGDGEGSGDSVG